MHYNENSTKCQAKTKAGGARYSILFPKYKKGGNIVRKVTYGKCVHMCN